MTFSHIPSKPLWPTVSPVLKNLNALGPRCSGDRWHLLSDAVHPALLSPPLGAGGHQSRGRCTLGLGSDSRSPEIGSGERRLLSTGVRGRSPRAPESPEGQPRSRGRDIPRDAGYGTGTAFWGLQLPPPRSPRDAKSDWVAWHRARPSTVTGRDAGGGPAEKGGPAGNPLTEGASLASSAPAPARLTFRSFSGRYLQSRAISTYLSKSRGAILAIRSPDGGGGGGSSGVGGGSWSSGGSGRGRSRKSSYVTSGP